MEGGEELAVEGQKGVLVEESLGARWGVHRYTKASLFFGVFC